MEEQELLGRTSSLLTSDMTRTTLKRRNRDITQTYGQQGDLISLITLKNYGGHTNRWTDRRQGDLISLITLQIMGDIKTDGQTDGKVIS
jgi:hypothetical protein